MQLVIADDANAIAAKTRLAQRWLDRLDQRMPIELDQALAFAATYQHVEALHRHVELERLDPLDGHAQGIVVTQVIELGAMLALDRLDPHRFALPVSLRSLPIRAGECRKALARCTIHFVDARGAT